MDLQKYMTFTTSWRKLLGENSDTHMPQYGDPVPSHCFQYGKNITVYTAEGCTTVSAKAYLTLDPVQLKDIYDGQVVKSVNNFPESWNSRVVLYEVLTWEV